jgi:hypothetical protein
VSLSTNRLVTASVNLTPSAAQAAALNTLLILGSTDVIDVGERMRSYADITSVASDFGTSAPEYEAAALYFSQSPRPTSLYIGRWAEAATAGLLKGKILSTAEKTLSVWTAVEDGAVKFAIDGGALQSLTALDFSAATNLNGVASIIDTALSGASVTWDGSRIRVISASTGASSTVSFATAGASGTDISAMLGMTAALGAVVDGIAAESAADAAFIFDDQFGRSWYALNFAESATMLDADHLAVAEYIQATPHTYGITSTDTDLLDATVTDDLASALSAASYTRTFVQYSENAYAVASFFGRALTVNFNGSQTALTMMYKVQPGVVPENLSNTQANALEDKRANVFALYDSGVGIIQKGTMAGSAFWDEIHGLDWLSSRIQTDVFNLLYTSPTKIPQTDAGTHLIVTVIEAACDQAVRNGLLAPGVWNSGGFGDLEQGDTLDRGFYIYAPPVSQQAQSDREARKSVPIQVAAKLAGAVHQVDCSILVNR